MRMPWAVAVIMLKALPMNPTAIAAVAIFAAADADDNDDDNDIDSQRTLVFGFVKLGGEVGTK